VDENAVVVAVVAESAGCCLQMYAEACHVAVLVFAVVIVAAGTGLVDWFVDNEVVVVVHAAVGVVEGVDEERLD
jgi:hypothetical protein